MIATRDNKANTGYIRIEEDLKFDFPLEAKLAYRVNAVDVVQNTASITHRLATYLSYKPLDFLRVYGEYGFIVTNSEKVLTTAHNYVAPESKYMKPGDAYHPFYLGAEFGHHDLSGKSHLFAHLRLMLTQHANLGMGGTLTYVVQGGAIFGKVPPTLLWHANANQGYAYDPYRFTMLHGYELMADKYVALHAEWNGQGILFNLIPGIRWLHLRELVEGKIAYGHLSKSVCALSASETSGLYSVSPKDGLYAEIGVGLGNILRVCDLYSVWGYTKDTRWQWAMRFRIHLGL